MKYIVFFLLLTTSFSEDINPNQKSSIADNNIDLINKHLQENYNLKLFKNLELILTGEIVKEPNISLDHKTYTTLKIDF